MSDDTSKLLNACVEYRAMVDKLERENAALRRDVYQCPPTSENDYEGFKWNDACEELERENAALNHALNIAQTELRLNGCAKAADEVAKLHDAARKEAQQSVTK